jgi:hypothetical protein
MTYVRLTMFDDHENAQREVIDVPPRFVREDLAIPKTVTIEYRDERLRAWIRWFIESEETVKGSIE